MPKILRSDVCEQTSVIQTMTILCNILLKKNNKKKGKTIITFTFIDQDRSLTTGVAGMTILAPGPTEGSYPSKKSKGKP